MSAADNVDAFRLDTEWDRDRADPGTPSRYGNYLRFEAETFEEIRKDYDDPTVPFIALAWRVATGPVMSPPYVIYPRRVTHVQLERNDWDGSSILRVDLVTDRPQSLQDAKTGDGRWFRGWSTRYDGGLTAIDDRDVASAPYLLPRADVLVPVPVGTLPRVGTGELLDDALAGVRAMVGLLNGGVGPLLDRLGAP